MKRDERYAFKLLRKYKVEIIANTLILLLIAVFQISGPLILRYVTKLISDNSDYRLALLWFFVTFSTLYLCKFLYNRFKFWFCEHFIIFIVSHSKEVFTLCNTLLYIKGESLVQTFGQRSADDSYIHACIA